MDENANNSSISVMTSSQRIILNTLATYARSVIAAGLALFSSRWILNALGQTDFGLYTLVGSLIVFVSLLNGVLGGTAGRFFAFAIGRNDSVEANQWFNTAVVIHTVLPVFLILLGWPIGEWCIRKFFIIPPDRVNACVWVFRLSLLAAFIAMLGVPYIAMFTAKQRIAEIAFWGLLQAVFTFLIAFILSYVAADRLVVYAVGMVALTIAITLIQILRASFIFPECRLVRQHWFNRGRTRKLFSFACWSLIGCLGGILRDHGTAILLNLFHGPRVNAAYGIANQVSYQTNTFAQAMIGALSPEINATAGRNDRKRLFDLALRASKFASLLALLFAIPLFIEMEYILRLWLKSTPAHTAIFCQVTILCFLLDKLTVGHMISVNANGKIAAYQATTGGTLLFTLPLGYLLLKLFSIPAAAMAAFLITSVGCALWRIYWGKKLLNIPPRCWFGGVLGRCSLVALPAAVLGAVPQFLFPATLPRLGMSILLSLTAIILLGWLVGLTKNERNYFIHTAQKAIAKAQRHWQTSAPSC